MSTSGFILSHVQKRNVILQTQISLSPSHINDKLWWLCHTTGLRSSSGKKSMSTFFFLCIFASVDFVSRQLSGKKLLSKTPKKCLGSWKAGAPVFSLLSCVNAFQRWLRGGPWPFSSVLFWQTVEPFGYNNKLLPANSWVFFTHPSWFYLLVVYRSGFSSSIISAKCIIMLFVQAFVSLCVYYIFRLDLQVLISSPIKCDIWPLPVFISQTMLELRINIKLSSGLCAPDILALLMLTFFIS